MRRNYELKKYPIVPLTLILILFLLLANCTAPEAMRTNDVVRGYIKTETGTVEGAVVTVQATDHKTVSDDRGYFELKNLASGEKLVITAWAEGYYIGQVETIPASEPITIHLSKYNLIDHADYDWTPHEMEGGSSACAECHPAYEEWMADAHSQSTVNPRFLSMYFGMDMAGNQSPITRYRYNRDYGILPLPPDPSRTYYGPGYKLDFPLSSGNCATCHSPAQAAHPGGEYSADPSEATGIEKEGIFCDFCHLIGGVTLDPELKLPYENMPGVLSIQLLRPENDGEDLFLGNFYDVPGHDSYLPIYEESKYCSACHYGVFWETIVYNSYGEWMDSSYSDSDDGQTCQECHMPPMDYDYFVYPEKGGLIRDSEKIFSHDMTGYMENVLLQNALSMSVETEINGNELNVIVEVINDKTGHAVPTDYPLRQVILIVDVIDGEGNRLIQTSGDVIPFYGGEGDMERGYYAGLPGKIYMKVLQELWTEVYPSGAYWNPTRVLSDNRLMPFEKDRSSFIFSINEEEPSYIHVKLLFRRATKELMDQKGWDIEDIVMESAFIRMN